MYTLQRYNVVKVTDSEVKRDKYLADGYKLVEEPVQPPAAPPEETPADKPEDKPAELPEDKPEVKEKPAKKVKSDD